MSAPAVSLGVGLIGLGRPWGHVPTAVPSEAEALDFLAYAYAAGLTFFDTAPSYGLSEARLGKFLRTLDPAGRRRLTIATKFGDHWNPATQSAYVDHSYEALRASLDRSLDLLGPIDLLQLHKTTPAVLQSEALAQAFAYARQQGVPALGASISDRASGLAVCASEQYTAVQLPYNLANTQFADVIDQATAQGKQVLINRPFKMGELTDPVAAFAFILRQPFQGVVLTGTKSPAHLRANLEAFRQAQAAGDPAHPAYNQRVG
jgi:aryl-alcohol dehydrogenase-like predicted oxidoreductase